MDQNNLILFEKKFRKNGYDFNRNIKFTIMERIENDLNQ